MSMEDDIPLVLDDLRPKPAFFSSPIGGKREEAFRSRSGLLKSKTDRDTFASILYRDGSMWLVYLYKSIRLEFEVFDDQSKPNQIRFIADKHNSCLHAAFEKQLITLCENASAKDKSSSLYSTVSKLLGELKRLDAAPKIRAIPYQHHVSRLLANRGTTWDLPLFLMRCAATSGKSSKLCTPFPPNINQNQLPSITLRYVRDNLLSYLQNPKQNIRPTHDEMSMIEFLSCLQWTEHARISCDDQPTVHTKENSNSCKLVKVSLDLNRDALPHFQEQVQKSGGSTKVYHGTSIENAWSIVNYGLLQHPSLQKNGAMLGPGVYLSSKYDVAYYFATQNGSVKYLPTEIWKTSPSFWRILGTTTSGPTRSLLEESRKNGLEMMCYAVLECSIANPCKEDKDSTRNRVKQNDTYFVVKSPHDIHMENIHLIFEFHKRPTFWKWTVWALLAAAVFLWKASQVLREKNATTYPEHFEL